jgi:hypothetical protein
VVVAVVDSVPIAVGGCGVLYVVVTEAVSRGPIVVVNAVAVVVAAASPTPTPGGVVLVTTKAVSRWPMNLFLLLL